MLSDDLPWPELGNVSRGATRGNQGQKGVVGSPDSEGRAILQLRVQPGVLAVRLNRQSTEWYRTLDSEVNNALKLTKTYWRKARRRQDYDARADQDHMELHEWLQQLKDKVMTHLELLMQKGEIQGPPYIMPDNIELTFLRKFMERHNARVPHNPRLRQAYLAGHSPQPLPHRGSIKSSDEASTPASMSWDDQDEQSSRQGVSPQPSGSLNDVQSLTAEIRTSQRALKDARATLARAQKDSHDAFIRYKTCLDAESKALQQVSANEERRDGLVSSLVAAYQTLGIEAPPNAVASDIGPDVSVSQHTSPRSAYRTTNDHMPDPSSSAFTDGSGQWGERPGSRWSRSEASSADVSASMGMPTDVHDGHSMSSRKHSRSWEREHAPFADATAPLPPRKRHQGTEDNIPRSMGRSDYQLHPLSTETQHPQIAHLSV
ncbi:hypothetical protein EUX98_g2982 [Antrodiella citrinella]|uniref:Uncharacterized protein n=1 Tax=Antrodiella citrinella TaxID=2447956 RepID=A0A4S4MYZ7_9APHY|nr:hypothetical protein EUX98_g2982 [Antrodiella citrinella]